MTKFLCCLMLALLPSAALAKESIQANCTYKGIPLYGKVKIVEHFPDIKVQAVSRYPDLRVLTVEGYADKCGRWEIVDDFADFTVQFVEHFPDITVQFVEIYPGLPRR